MNGTDVMQMPRRPSDTLKKNRGRGRFMSAHDVAREILGGVRSAKWVKRNLPGKIQLGHRTVGWWERDVLRYLDDQREEAP